MQTDTLTYEFDNIEGTTFLQPDRIKLSNGDVTYLYVPAPEVVPEPEFKVGDIVTCSNKESQLYSRRGIVMEIISRKHVDLAIVEFGVIPYGHDGSQWTLRFDVLEHA